MSQNETVTGAQLHGAAYTQARAAYKSIGWTCTGRPANEADGKPQPRLDLANSGLVAVEIPSECWYVLPGLVADPRSTSL